MTQGHFMMDESKYILKRVPTLPGTGKTRRPLVLPLTARNDLSKTFLSWRATKATAGAGRTELAAREQAAQTPSTAQHSGEAKQTPHGDSRHAATRFQQHGNIVSPLSAAPTVGIELGAPAQMPDNSPRIRRDLSAATWMLQLMNRYALSRKPPLAGSGWQRTTRAYNLSCTLPPRPPRRPASKPAIVASTPSLKLVGEGQPVASGAASEGPPAPEAPSAMPNDCKSAHRAHTALAGSPLVLSEPVAATSSSQQHSATIQQQSYEAAVMLEEVLKWKRELALRHREKQRAQNDALQRDAATAYLNVSDSVALPSASAETLAAHTPAACRSTPLSPTSCRLNVRTPGTLGTPIEGVPELFLFRKPPAAVLRGATAQKAENVDPCSSLEVGLTPLEGVPERAVKRRRFSIRTGFPWSLEAGQGLPAQSNCEHPTSHAERSTSPLHAVGSTAGRLRAEAVGTATCLASPERIPAAQTNDGSSCARGEATTDTGAAEAAAGAKAGGQEEEGHGPAADGAGELTAAAVIAAALEAARRIQSLMRCPSGISAGPSPSVPPSLRASPGTPSVVSGGVTGGTPALVKVHNLGEAVVNAVQRAAEAMGGLPTFRDARAQLPPRPPSAGSRGTSVTAAGGASSRGTVAGSMLQPASVAADGQPSVEPLIHRAQSGTLVFPSRTPSPMYGFGWASAVRGHAGPVAAGGTPGVEAGTETPGSSSGSLIGARVNAVGSGAAGGTASLNTRMCSAGAFAGFHPVARSTASTTPLSIDSRNGLSGYDVPDSVAGVGVTATDWGRHSSGSQAADVDMAAEDFGGDERLPDSDVGMDLSDAGMEEECDGAGDNSVGEAEQAAARNGIAAPGENLADVELGGTVAGQGQEDGSNDEERDASESDREHEGDDRDLLAPEGADGEEGNKKQPVSEVTYAEGTAAGLGKRGDDAYSEEPDTGQRYEDKDAAGNPADDDCESEEDGPAEAEHRQDTRTEAHAASGMASRSLADLGGAPHGVSAQQQRRSIASGGSDAGVDELGGMGGGVDQNGRHDGRSSHLHALADASVLRGGDVDDDDDDIEDAEMAVRGLPDEPATGGKVRGARISEGNTAAGTNRTTLSRQQRSEQAKGDQPHPGVSKAEKLRRAKSEAADLQLQKRREVNGRKSLAGIGLQVEEGGRRRSTRTRVRPLEYWRGEAKSYGRAHKTMPTIVSIKMRTPDPQWPLPSGMEEKKKRKARTKLAADGATQAEDG